MLSEHTFDRAIECYSVKECWHSHRITGSEVYYYSSSVGIFALVFVYKVSGHSPLMASGSRATTKLLLPGLVTTATSSSCTGLCILDVHHCTMYAHKLHATAHIGAPRYLAIARRNCSPDDSWTLTVIAEAWPGRVDLLVYYTSTRLATDL